MARDEWLSRSPRRSHDEWDEAGPREQWEDTQGRYPRVGWGEDRWGSEAWRRVGRERGWEGRDSVGYGWPDGARRTYGWPLDHGGEFRGGYGESYYEGGFEQRGRLRRPRRREEDFGW
ncbi:MAG: hypothetical protein HY561_07600 [Gemmatimonadetes bacterium]|nr:hypothetical protein [Gemmatimonadota bacterium]